MQSCPARTKGTIATLAVLATVLLFPAGVSAEMRAAERTRREKSFTVEHKYLVMPIQNKGRGNTVIHLYIDDEKVRQHKLQPAPSAEETDWYAYFTIEGYKGKEARVVVDSATDEGFALIRPSDTIPGEENFYKEPHRPQFHFSQKVGWNNDVNGTVYHGGKWHLFFQHNPVGLGHPRICPGNKTWGHATSTDLVHWEQQPNKLFPATMAVGQCFSGSATVDKKNTAGWGENALVAIFTDTGCGEAVAYSTDGGESFTYYEGNPVVKHKGRDPKVIWYEYDDDDEPLNAKTEELGGHWVMAVFAEHGKKIAFYTSSNLKDWAVQSHLPGYYECPELFELPVDGNEDDTRWVVFAADARYAVGRFDGRVFTPEHEGKHQVHHGPYYASQCFNHAPDGRVIQIGWAMWKPYLKGDGAPGPYNQHFSFPHELTLRTTADGIRMFAKPVKEIEELRIKSHRADAQPLADGKPVSLPVGTDLLDIRLDFEVGTARSIVLDLPGRSVAYDARGRKVHRTPLEPVDGRVSLQVLADRSLTEISGNDGRVYISGDGPAKIENPSPVSVTAHGGDAKLVSLEVHELKSIW